MSTSRGFATRERMTLFIQTQFASQCAQYHHQKNTLQTLSRDDCLCILTSQYITRIATCYLNFEIALLNQETPNSLGSLMKDRPISQSWMIDLSKLCPAQSCLACRLLLGVIRDIMQRSMFHNVMPIIIINAIS